MPRPTKKAKTKKAAAAESPVPSPESPATAVAIVERVLKGEVKPGYQTPSMAYGADFILEFEGVKREDL